MSPQTPQELEQVVQQELDFTDMCHRCEKPVDDCLCPDGPWNGRHDREDAQPPATHRTAWTCPYCDHLNSELNRYCAECGEMYGVSE